jgi:hypothetical protein
MEPAALVILHMSGNSKRCVLRISRMFCAQLVQSGVFDAVMRGVPNFRESEDRWHTQPLTNEWPPVSSPCSLENANARTSSRELAWARSFGRTKTMSHRR